MSETVKLIIEIPQKEYEAFKELIAINIGGRFSGKGIIYTCLNAVKNGITLDDVKTEIEQKAWDTQEADGEHDNYEVVDLSDVLEILDSIGKGDKE